MRLTNIAIVLKFVFVLSVLSEAELEDGIYDLFTEALEIEETKEMIKKTKGKKRH